MKRCEITAKQFADLFAGLEPLGTGEANPDNQLDKTHFGLTIELPTFAPYGN